MLTQNLVGLLLKFLWSSGAEEGGGAPGRRQHIRVMRVLALEPFSLHLISHPPLNKYFIASPSQAWFGHLVFLN